MCKKSATIALGTEIKITNKNSFENLLNILEEKSIWQRYGF